VWTLLVAGVVLCYWLWLPHLIVTTHNGNGTPQSSLIHSTILLFIASYLICWWLTQHCYQYLILHGIKWLISQQWSRMGTEKGSHCLTCAICLEDTKTTKKAVWIVGLHAETWGIQIWRHGATNLTPEFGIRTIFAKYLQYVLKWDIGEEWRSAGLKAWKVKKFDTESKWKGTSDIQ